MARRPLWKGYLKLSLVACPVVMEPARTAEETIGFRTNNRDTGNRVEGRYVDAETGDEVESSDQVEAYALEDGTPVMIEDDELEAAALDGARTIDIDRFAPAEDIDWIRLGRPHCLRPADAIGDEAFAVIREAMAVTRTAALARLALHRRERAVVLIPGDRGIVLWTLRSADAKSTRLFGEPIDGRFGPWSPDLVSDPVQDLEAIIAGKTPKTGRAAPNRKAGAEPTEDNVVSILDALKRSLAAGKKTR